MKREGLTIILMSMIVLVMFSIFVFTRREKEPEVITVLTPATSYAVSIDAVR